MNPSRLLVLCAAACLAATAATAAPLGAGPSGVANRIASFAPPPSPKAVLHTPLGTVINEADEADISLPAGGLTNTDSLSKIDCKPAAGCTINIRTWGQFSATADGMVAFCPQVDGNQVFIGCSYLGVIRSADIYGFATGAGTYSVAQGVHQIRTQAYLGGGGTLVSYHYDYELFTP